ncbi:MAG: GntR family transcriptional regulator, partial [Oscillospiraceae bacterium]
MAWKLDDNKPVYLQLIEQIKRKILTGEYKAGDKIPSVRDLAMDAAVNPNTMQRALQDLERD